MKGLNPIRKPVLDEGKILAVQEIFATLQGEGPFAGHPAVFIRLGGCNLACGFCDTEFESFHEMPLDAVASEAERIAGAAKLVVITGGEPLRQNIVPLCEGLIAAGFTVQVETNGTLYRALPQGVHIICSPKASNGQYHSVRPDLAAQVDAFKFIISESDETYRDVPDVGQGTTPVYVQPMDEYDAQKNAANLKRATELAIAKGYRLSLQLHKIAGIP